MDFKDMRVYPKMSDTTYTDSIGNVDPLIVPAVEILHKHGFHTIESCQGGDGHAYHEPTVIFDGTEFDLIKAYELCNLYGLNVYSVKRVYGKEPVLEDVTDGREIGENWVSPVNEITFMVHSKTGTIYRPC